MSEFEITCVTKSARTPAGHQHIIGVGLRYGTRCTVEDVYTSMDAGSRFYTRSPSTGDTAQVGKDYCRSCRINTLRSAADAVQDNNLDNLDPCRVS